MPVETYSFGMYSLSDTVGYSIWNALFLTLLLNALSDLISILSVIGLGVGLNDGPSPNAFSSDGGTGVLLRFNTALCCTVLLISVSAVSVLCTGG